MGVYALYLFTPVASLYSEIYLLRFKNIIFLLFSHLNYVSKISLMDGTEWPKSVKLSKTAGQIETVYWNNAWP